MTDSNRKSIRNRAIIALSLVLILFLLCAYYQTNYEYHSEYPSVKSIVSNYSRYMGETVSVYGEVVGVHNTTFQLLERYNGKSIIFVITPDSKVDVDIGDEAEVLGSLNPDYRITAEKIIIIKKWKLRSVYISSLIGLILLIFVFRRYWKFDFKRMRFVKRE